MFSAHPPPDAGSALLVQSCASPQMSQMLLLPHCCPLVHWSYIAVLDIATSHNVHSMPFTTDLETSLTVLLQACQ